MTTLCLWLNLVELPRTLDETQSRRPLYVCRNVRNPIYYDSLTRKLKTYLLSKYRGNPPLKILILALYTKENPRIKN